MRSRRFGGRVAIGTGALPETRRACVRLQRFSKQTLASNRQRTRWDAPPKLREPRLQNASTDPISGRHLVKLNRVFSRPGSGLSERLPHADPRRQGRARSIFIVFDNCRLPTEN